MPPAPKNPPFPPESSQSRPDAWFLQDVHAHDGQLKAYLRSRFSDFGEVDDIVQESYLRVWKAGVTRLIESPKAFLFTVARHLAVRKAQEKRRTKVELAGDLSQMGFLEGGHNPAEEVSYREKVSLLAEAIALLPARCRQVVILRKLQSLPQKEVAAHLGISERTVENQLARGVARCHEFFRERGVERLF